MSEPTIHIRRIKDPETHSVQVEQEGPAAYKVTAPSRLEWLEALEAVERFAAKREGNERA